MRAVLQQNDSRQARVGSRPDTRRAERSRKSRLREMALEWLESRQLLSTLPTPIVTTQVNVSNNANGSSNDSAPSISIDPLTPSHMVSVWTHYDTSQQAYPNPQSYIQWAYSTNSGASWNAQGKLDATIFDFTSTATPTPVLAQGTDATVAFDRNHNFYILSTQHKADNGVGELLLDKFQFSGGFPSQTLSSDLLPWNGDAVLKPTLAVDDNAGNATSYSDPGGTTQNDTSTGNVYVAWESSDATPPNTGNWNPNAIRMMMSSDGGNTFSGYITLNSGGNFGNQRNGAPRIAIAQGSATVPAGQVSVVWDDFGSFANASPTPLDGIITETVAAPTSQTFTSTPNPTPINPAVTVPAATNGTTTVTIPASAVNISNLTVQLSISDGTMADLGLSLTAPGGGPTVQLFAIGGVTGANMGTTGATYLNANAPRTLANGAAPYIGTFQVGGLNAFKGGFAAGNWTLNVTSSNTAEAGRINFVNLIAATNFQAGAQQTTALVDVRGTQNFNYTTASAANPFGIGPDPSLAYDNTLGSYSPNQGRLYLTYVDRFDSNVATYTGNPADNTDIFMLVSDNGGQSWKNASTGAAFVSSGRGYNGQIVNNDNGQVDGFSGANGASGTNGREQFQPSVAVDPGTGAVVVTYYDGRYDPSRARVAMTIAASSDGGQTFSQTFANAPITVYNQGNTATVTVGPTLDNESTGNTANNNDRTLYGFGDHQGVAVMNGQIYPIWSSNQNGGVDGKQLLNIWTAPTEIAVGPRIISGSMGAIGLDGNGNVLDALNNTFTLDGTPILNTIKVTFDRQVDTSTFGVNSVVVQYESPSGAITPITPTLVKATGATKTVGAKKLATQFLITIPNQSAVGTYSYEIKGTTIANLTPFVNAAGTIVSGSKMDQNGNATGGEAADFFAVPTPTGTTPFAGPYSRDTLPIIIPGPHVISTQVPNVAKTADNLVLNGTVSALNVTFDRDITPGTLTAASVLQVIGPAGDVTKPQLYTSTDQNVPIPSLATYTSTMVVNPAQAFTIADLKVFLNLQAADDSQIAVSLQSPDGTVTVPLVNAGDTPAGDKNFTGTTFSDLGVNLTTIKNAPAPKPPATTNAPYSATYLPVSSLDAGFAGLNLSGPWRLIVKNNGTNATLTNWALEATPKVTFTVSQLSSRVFQIGFPTQNLSGTYTVTLAPSATSMNGGFGTDTNLNAGVDQLRGTASTASIPLTNTSTDTPVLIQANAPVTSKITIPNNFVIQPGTLLQLDITYPNDPDLTVNLIAPDGTVINLFTNLSPSGTTANFSQTVFSDSAATKIANGSAPYLGQFQPASPLSVLNGANSLNGPSGTPTNGAGVYTLQVINKGTSSGAGVAQINSWSLTLQQPGSGTGLSEPVADRIQTSFRIFTEDPTNPLSSNTWTAVGPASVGGANSGRIGGLAIDPSDPSGNTVYVAGASGGVWKTNNFLTTASGGPTYIPLTDFGPTFSLNIGGIAVFGRNNNPNQSIVFAATGEGDTGSAGVGVLRSMDGGATWTLLDSTDNTVPYSQRDHAFVGSTSYKIIVDPNPTSTGQVAVFMALSGQNGGIWQSLDSGATWGVYNPISKTRSANLPGQATDVVFDQMSGTINTVSNPSGNLQVVYGALRGQGVYISPNEGQVWNLMVGGVGDPLIQDRATSKPIPVTQPAGATPNGPYGRIVLATPALVASTVANSAQQNLIYGNWLYAAVVTPDGNLRGLYLTKDQGENWTQVRVPTLPTPAKVTSELALPSNDTNLGDYNPLGFAGSGFGAQGNYDISLAVNPVNPAVVYIGGTTDGPSSGLIRIDTTALIDPHALFQSNELSDGGTLTVNSAGGVALTTPANKFTSLQNPTINLERNPAGVLTGGGTFYVNNIASFLNSGAGATWIPFGQALGGTDQHRVVTMVDPLTGQARLIFGDDQGVFSSVDNNGVIDPGIGTQSTPSISRNGNLQVTQFYYGAVQPSNSAAIKGGSMFYGQAQDDGFPRSAADTLTSGNISWSGPAGDGAGVATDQTGSGTLYQYNWPCCGGNTTDFFQVNGVGRTNGLIQTSGAGGGGPGVPDPQWPNLGNVNFAVNPINGSDIVISSTVGRIFRTQDQGLNWLVIADPATLDSTQSLAQAYGAPSSTGSSIDNYLLVGTNGGHIYATYTGGGAAGNSWYDISAGITGGAVQAIVTDPSRGTYDAYAVTSGGVFYMANTQNAATGGASWQRITGNLFNLSVNPFSDPSFNQTQLNYLTSLQVDWRYLIPNNPATPGAGSHPLLYVGGNGGVYDSLNQGATWQSYPSTAINSYLLQKSPPGVGGGLPNNVVTDLSMSIGNVDPTTGHAVIAAGDPNALVATTFGRGTFSIRLAPTVMPNTNAGGVNPDYLKLDTFTQSTSTGVESTTSPTPVIDGFSEQSAFGNTVTVTLYDLTNVLNGVVGATPTPIPLTGTVTTDGNGNFKLHVAPGYFTTAGIYTLGAQAVDQTGAKGNMAELTFVFDPIPPAPTGLTLDSTTDSGSSNTDQYTNFNNANASLAPLFDVSGIEVPPTGYTTTVILERATQVNGVVGAFSVVNTQAYTPAQIAAIASGLGSVQIQDLNGGNGTIADTSLNPIIDTAPNQPNQYVYEAFQTDFLNNPGTPYVAPKGVIVDTKAPLTPSGVTLDPSSDSGTLNGDQYTNFNNSKNNPPLFDVAGIEPNATVELFRTNSAGATTLVNSVQFSTAQFVAGSQNPVTQLGTVRIADINANNSTIPDSTLSLPINTAPLATTTYNGYVYSAIQVDLAGNPSGQSQSTFGNAGAVVLDGTDADNHGSFANGANVNGWLYMQTVVQAIVPNVTDGKKVLVALGADPSINPGGGGGGGGGGFGQGSAVQSIYHALQQAIDSKTGATLVSEGWTVEYVTGIANITSFLAGQPANAVDVNNASVGTITSANTGLLYIPTEGHSHVRDDLTDPELGIIDANGPAIAAYVNQGGGLYTQSENGVLFGGFGGGGGGKQTSPDYGWLSSLFPGLSAVDVSNGTSTNIQITAAGQATFPGLTAKDLQGGPWHNYFVGTLPSSLAVMYTVADPTNKSVNDILGLSSAGAPPVVTSGAKVIIDSTAPLQSVTTLDSTTDSGSLNNDQFTNFNNSANNPPLFDVTNIEPNGIVKLYRTPYDPVNRVTTGAAVLVNTQTQAPGGTLGNWSITDTNAGNGKIPDGYYLYTNTQTDLAGNVGPASTGVVVDVLTAPPSAPTKIILDPTTDSGTSNTDQYTNFNNSTASLAPLLDVYGIGVPPGAPAGELTTVVLLRAAEVGGVVPTAAQFQIVDTQTYPNSYFTSANYKGFVQIADTNGGNGKIADTPVNNPLDTAPPQPNQYIYAAYQIDFVNNVGNTYHSPNGVIIDSTAPNAPASVKLDASADSGNPNRPGLKLDSYTNFNNSPNKVPLFNVTGIEPNATVELFRTDPTTGITKLVNTITLSQPTGLKNGLGTVQIADINAGNGVIADDVAAGAVNVAPPAGTPYQYTAIQIDLAGNQSQQSRPVFGNSGAIIIDGTDSDNHGQLDVNNKVLGGWLYMRDALNAMLPNITSNATTMVALGVEPTSFFGGQLFGATGGAYYSFQQSVLPSKGWNLAFVTSTNLDSYLAGNSVPALNQLGASIGNITINQTGLMYIATANRTGDDLNDAALAQLDAHGPDIQNYVNTGGGLFTMAEQQNFDPKAVPYGWLSTLFPGVTVPLDSTVGPYNIQITPLGQAIFPGLTAADLSFGPWHEFFALAPSVTALAPVFTDTLPASYPQFGGQTVILGLSSVGSTSGGASSGSQVTIDTAPPVLPGNSIDPTSISGQTFQGIAYTNHNNSNANPPIFDTTNMEPFGQLNLYRAAYNPATGIYGAPVLVNVVLASGNGGATMISDVNGAFNGAAGNGAIADGQYQYNVQQIDLAGNFLNAGSPVVLVIDTKAPAAPLSIHLDSTTDSGTYNNDSYTQDNNGQPYPSPLFDVTGVEKYASVELFRQLVVGGLPVGNPVLVNTVVDTVPTGANNLVQIADINNSSGVIPDGVYLYTAEQVDLAANVGPPTVPGTKVTIDSLIPQPNPPAAPTLSPASDTGTFNNDQYTEDNNSSTFPAPIFLAGNKNGFGVEPHDTVDLWRAPVNIATGAVGAPILVHQLLDTAGGVISISDTNAGNGTIPDGKYMYYIQLIDLAGNVGSFSSGLTVIIDTTSPATPSPLRLDAVTDTGVSNSDGNTQLVRLTHPIFDAGGVEKGATLTLYRAPINVQTGIVGAAVAVNTLVNVQPGGLTQIQDPQSIVDGKYQYTVRQVDLSGNQSQIGSAITIIYNNVQPPLTDFTTKLTLDPSNTGVNPAGNQTNATAPVFDITVNFPLNASGFNFNNPSKLTLVRDGSAVNPIVNGASPDQLSYYTVTGGQVKIQDPGPVPLGVHSYQVFLTDLAGNSSALSAPLTVTFAPSPPGTIALDSGSDSGVKGDNITNVATPTFDVVVPASAAGGSLRLLQAGLTVTTIPVPANFTGGTLKIIEPNTLANGVYTFSSQLVSPNGNPSPPGGSVTITINTTPPIAPSGVKLDPNSDSGLIGDGITNFNGAANLPVQIDASGIIAGSTVNLYRSTFDAKTGIIGTPLLVNTIVSQAGGTITINDLGGPGAAPGVNVVPDGNYQYTVQQVNVAGNTSPSSSPASVTIDTSVPATPAITLDPASNSGPPNATTPTTNVINPYFDVTGVVNGTTVSLYRSGLATPVKVLANVVIPANGIVKIQDPGPLSNGTYTYYVTQKNIAGTFSNPSANYSIIINSAAPATPNAPKLSLDVKTDTGVVGDNITAARLLILDGSADPGVIINLYNTTGSSPVFLATTNANGIGQFQIALPKPLNDGNYKFAATATDAKQQTSPLSGATPLLIKVVTVSGDYNGDSKTELALARRTSPSLIQWFVSNDAALGGPINFGAGSLDVPVAGDFYGYGFTDPALYEPSTGKWYAMLPANTATNPPSGYVGKLISTFGGPTDIPAPGNYSGNNVSQIAVYRPSTGVFYVLTSALGVSPTTNTPYNTGITNGLPVPGDYLNAGYDQPAVFKASANGDTWTMAVNAPGTSQGYVTNYFGGGAGDLPVPGNYDTIAAYKALATATFAGTEEAVWQPASGQYVVRGATAVAGQTAGRIYKFTPGDLPVPGDYDGFGVTEPAVYRPSTGQWLVYGPNDNPANGPRVLGSFGDPASAPLYAPPLAPYPYRKLGNSSGIIASSLATPLNFGASAAALVAATPAPSKQVFGPLAVFPVATTRNTPATPRVRPAQAAASVPRSACWPPNISSTTPCPA